MEASVPARAAKGGNGKGEQTTTHNLETICNLLHVERTTGRTFIASIPFAPGDVTAGCENELQAVVVGGDQEVDLPMAIRESSYYRNLLKRAGAGDTPRSRVDALEEFLASNEDHVWENSWVRFPRAALSDYASQIFAKDLRADKSRRRGPKRKDAGRFTVAGEGEAFLRVPVSYLLKLALADAVSGAAFHSRQREIGSRFLRHFSNDNTSPETYSFHPVPVTSEFGMGRGLAKETLRRFLLCQLLTQYANDTFLLKARGQQALVYFAPHPPVRQKMLNDLISDAFYRELFMSPCLSGWDRGEDKHQYMILCHQVLSRSQMNGIAKLREAGIITSNLVVLPNISNVSLANNGTHVSLGSRKLAAALGDLPRGFTEADEKYLGDLVIKIVEHFLPLFVGAYSAAPYRLDFWDFHPEKVLGFLPHELDFTHLRMIWRRWKKKANLCVFGQPSTPFGPEWLDRLVSRVLGLRGDFVGDFRLIDYFVSLMSTDNSPGLDGTLGNDLRLKQDLATMGVFDPDMAVYLLYRLRQASSHGFSGFEGRHYSVFASLLEDMGQATNLQTLVTALAFKYILKGEITHAHIPDDPAIESERRQVFFGTAIGIPTFFVRRDTANHLLRRILAKVRRMRLSHRYHGYLRIYNLDYRKALMEVLREEGADLIEVMGLEETVKDMERRIEAPDLYSAAGRITGGILEQAGASSPLKLSGREFNLAAERYYRETLRRLHMEEAFTVLAEDLRRMDTRESCGEGPSREALAALLGGRSASEFLASVRDEIMEARAPRQALRTLIHLVLLAVQSDLERSERERSLHKDDEILVSPSVYRPPHLAGGDRTALL
jgi:hypothetical protein